MKFLYLDIWLLSVIRAKFAHPMKAGGDIGQISHALAIAALTYADQHVPISYDLIAFDKFTILKDQIVTSVSESLFEGSINMTK